MVQQDCSVKVKKGVTFGQPYWSQEKQSHTRISRAVREGIDSSYVSRVVNLTTHAPDIITAILGNKLPNDITLFDLAVDPPMLWEEQREQIKTALST